MHPLRFRGLKRIHHYSSKSSSLKRWGLKDFTKPRLRLELRSLNVYPLNLYHNLRCSCGEDNELSIELLLSFDPLVLIYAVLAMKLTHFGIELSVAYPAHNCGHVLHSVDIKLLFPFCTDYLVVVKYYPESVFKGELFQDFHCLDHMKHLVIILLFVITQADHSTFIHP